MAEETDLPKGFIELELGRRVTIYRAKHYSYERIAAQYEALGRPVTIQQLRQAQARFKRYRRNLTRRSQDT